MRFDELVLFHPEAGRCLAAATVASLQDRAAAHGADVRFGVGPASFAVDASGDGVRVRASTTSGRHGWWWSTAGAWVREVVGGIELGPTTVTLEQVQHFTPARLRTTRGRASSTTAPTAPSCTACSRRARG